MSRILTSHVGSLPRTQEVVDYIFARENNQKYNEKSFDECMEENVLKTVEKQKSAGIDIISDGETSKISYATYEKEQVFQLKGRHGAIIGLASMQESLVSTPTNVVPCWNQLSGAFAPQRVWRCGSFRSHLIGSRSGSTVW